MYNSMSALPYIPYNILVYLAKNNEIIWKLLKYNTYDALSQPNLSFSEKMNLIWREGPQEKYGVFLTNLVEDAIAESKCVFKVYNFYNHATALYHATSVYAFELLFGGKMSLVDYNGIPASRADLFLNQVLSTLNGVNVGGVGKLVFLDDMSRYNMARAVVGNSKTFTGVQLFMSVIVGDGGEDTGCGG